MNANRNTQGFSETEIPDNQTEQPFTQLNKKQRAMILKRKATKTRPKSWKIAITAVLLIAFVFITQFFGHSINNTYDKPGDDIVLTMDFVGDVMLGRNIQEEGEKDGYSQYYQNVEEYWQNADIAFANLESCVLSKNGTYQEAEKNKGSIYLSATRGAVKTLINAGINALGCANNHTGDYGIKPIVELCDWLDTHADMVSYAGIGRDQEEAVSYKVFDEGGIKVGFVAMTETYYQNFAAKRDKAGAFTTAYSAYNEVIYEAKQESDILVVYIHFGEENEPKINDEQKLIAHRLIDAGADIIIGSHPHVLQETELYKNGIIFYSLGNFIFDQGNTFSRDTVMIQYTLDKNGDGAFEVIPMRINDGIPGETANPFFRARISREITQGLSEDSYYYDEDGHIIISAVNLDLSKTLAVDSRIGSTQLMYLSEGEED